MTPFEAGQRLAQIARNYDLAFFDHWLTDYVGHRGTLSDAMRLLQTLDQVIAGLVPGSEETILADGSELFAPYDPGNQHWMDLAEFPPDLDPAPGQVIAFVGDPAAADTRALLAEPGDPDATASLGRAVALAGSRRWPCSRICGIRRVRTRPRVISWPSCSPRSAAISASAPACSCCSRVLGRGRRAGAQHHAGQDQDGYNSKYFVTHVSSPLTNSRFLNQTDGTKITLCILPGYHLLSKLQTRLGQ
jgi:hypothetical protein